MKDLVLLEVRAVERMAEKVHFLPVDLRIHSSEVIDLNIEYMDWWLRGLEECFKPT